MKKRVLILIGVLFVVLCFVFVFFDCRSLLLKNDTEKITRYLSTVKIGGVFNLSKDCSQCDSVYIIKPYSANFFTINRNIDMKDCVKDKFISVAKFDEGCCQLLFVKNNKAIAYAEIPRNIADFSEIKLSKFSTIDNLILNKNRRVSFK